MGYLVTLCRISGHFGPIITGPGESCGCGSPKHFVWGSYPTQEHAQKTCNTLIEMMAGENA